MLYREITGDEGKRNLDFDEIADSGEELLRMVRAWREKLGTKRDLLDQYLAALLYAIIDTANARDTAEQGFDDAMAELRDILRRFKEGKQDEARQHPFYPKVRAYMDAHPFGQDLLFYETYCVGLFGEYLSFALEGFINRCDEAFKAYAAKYHVPHLREALLSSAADITKDDLSYLDNLISRVLYWVAPSTIFMQGMADQLLLSLAVRDGNSGKFVFQRLLDDEVSF